jgi:hypothetical protein
MQKGEVESRSYALGSGKRQNENMNAKALHRVEWAS